MSLGDKNTPMSVRENLTLIAFVAAAVGWGLSLKWGLADTQKAVLGHTSELVEVKTSQKADHEILVDMRAEQKAQARILNYLANGRRGEPPIISSTTNPGSP